MITKEFFNFSFLDVCEKVNNFIDDYANEVIWESIKVTTVYKNSMFYSTVEFRTR